ncbi:MAG: DMT family transporter [Deltaproteobacteria bacterium]|nr:DMT family transporter [Deltaproteobacteria bacterium]
MRHEHERTGLLFAALCALNGAFVPAVAKLTTNRAEPFFVATSAALFAGIAAAVVLAYRGQLAALIARPNATGLFVVGALGTAGAFTMFFWGAQRASAIETVVCLQSEPAYSLLLAWLFLGHAPTPRRMAATAALLIGIVLAVGGRVALSPGVLVLLGAPLCWQLSHLIVLLHLDGVPALVITGGRYVYGGVLLSAIWLLRGGLADLPPTPDLIRLLPLLATQGIILSYAGTLVWYLAVLRLDLARTTAIVVPSIPLLSLVASFLLLGEIPTLQQWIGLLFAASGVAAFVAAPAADKRPAARRASGPAPGLPASEPGTHRD